VSLTKNSAKEFIFSLSDNLGADETLRLIDAAANEVLKKYPNSWDHTTMIVLKDMARINSYLSNGIWCQYCDNELTKKELNRYSLNDRKLFESPDFPKTAMCTKCEKVRT
jgi:hypothetical protein